MDRGEKNSLKIVFILIFIFNIFVFGQVKQADEEKRLREEILAAYKTGGEQGLLIFVKKNKYKITSKFIVDFADAGVEEKKEKWLKISLILIKKHNDEKKLAYVYFKTSEYYRLNSKNKEAIDYLEKALSIYIKTNDFLSQGNLYLRKGEIYFNAKKYASAIKMYDKALLFYEKVGEPLGLGNVFTGKGRVYFKTGDNPKALEMYDMAMPYYSKAKNLTSQGTIFLGKGDIYLATGENNKALEMYNKAFIFFKKVGDPLRLGGVYLRKEDVYFYTGNNSKALEMCEKALHFFEKALDPLGQGNVYLHKGNIYYKMGENSKATAMYDKALPFFEKAKYSTGIGYVLYNKGEIFFLSGNDSKSLEMYDKALLFYEKGGSLLGQGNVYNSKGVVYSYIGDESKAFEMYNKALLFFKKVGEPIGQGNVYVGKGDIYLKIGKFSKAIEMYEKGLPFFEKAMQPFGMGEVYNGIGKIFSLTGDCYKALEMYEKALHLYEKIGATRSQGNIYIDKGIVYLRIGYYSKAIQMCDKAFSFFKKADDPFGQATVYMSKGIIFSRNGDYLKARKMFDKILPFYKKVGDFLSLGNIYKNIGNIYLLIGDFQKALEMYNMALEFFEKFGGFTGKGNVFLSKGDIFFNIGDIPRSLEMYNKAIDHYNKGGDLESKSYALHGKARVMLKHGKKSKALTLFEEVISNLEKVRTQTAFSEMKINFMEKVYDQYEETVLFMLENQYYDKGFKYAEAMRTRVFLDQMAEGLVRLDKGLTPDMKEKRDELVSNLSQVSKVIHNTAGGTDENKLKELKNQYRKIEDEFQDMLIKIRLENPLYTSVRYPRPISVQELQKEILKKGEILVRYFITSDKIYVFLVSKKKFKVVPLEIKKEELNGITERYLLAIKENKSNAIKKFGISLYKKLLKPLKKRLKKTREIRIIPDGKLAAIPFESLIIDKEKSGHPVFLIEKYRIKYIQSASILSVLRKHYQQDRETQNFIGFGDPVYDYKNFTAVTIPSGSPNPSFADEIKEIHRGKLDRAGGKLVRLKGSGHEIKAVAELFKRKKSAKCAVYLRKEATEENAKAKHMKDFDFIHLACHGLLNDDFQCLVLSQDIPDAKDDGYFTLNEIMNCDYNAKLVVLSGCQTGSGKMERAEGVTGLTRAVMYAGTPAVLASLWKVDDTATKELMVRFYENMLEKNLDKAEALRQAKLELINNKKYRSPIFWSAFVMYGE